MANTDNPTEKRIRRTSLEMIMAACTDFRSVFSSHAGPVAKRAVTVEDVPAWKELREALKDCASVANDLSAAFAPQLEAIEEKAELIRLNEEYAARIAELEEKLRIVGEGSGEAAPANPPTRPRVGKGSKSAELSPEIKW